MNIPERSIRLTPTGSDQDERPRLHSPIIKNPGRGLPIETAGRGITQSIVDGHLGPHRRKERIKMLSNILRTIIGYPISPNVIRLEDARLCVNCESIVAEQMCPSCGSKKQIILGKALGERKGEDKCPFLKN